MSQALKIYTETDWTAFALLLFFSFFVMLVYEVYFSKKSSELEQQKMVVFGGVPELEKQNDK